MRRDTAPTVRCGRRVARFSELGHQNSSRRANVSHAAVVANTFPCSDRRICRAIAVLTQDLTQRTSLVEAAQIAGLTPNYFSSCFRKSVGVTFVGWSSRLRIGEAKRLLAIADLSITAVAASVGYADVTTFERVFRRLEGTCPRTYRRLFEKHGRAIVRNAESNVRNAETRAIGSPYVEQSARPALFGVASGAPTTNDRAGDT